MILMMTVAMPLIMSVYVGIAQKAAELSIGPYAAEKKTDSRIGPL